jgi:hypothetical protein
MYAKIVNNEVVVYPYNINRLYKENPNVSFPAKISEEILNNYNIYSITKASAPSHDNSIQQVIQADPTLVDGVWTQTWTVTSLPTTTAEDNIRSDRDGRLKETDYYALSDTPSMTTEMSTYRQALRDITSQSGFPFNVTWPTKP